MPQSSAADSQMSLFLIVYNDLINLVFDLSVLLMLYCTCVWCSVLYDNIIFGQYNKKRRDDRSKSAPNHIIMLSFSHCSALQILTLHLIKPDRCPLCRRKRANTQLSSAAVQILWHVISGLAQRALVMNDWDTKNWENGELISSGLSPPLDRKHTALYLLCVLLHFAQRYMQKLHTHRESATVATLPPTIM